MRKNLLVVFLAIVMSMFFNVTSFAADDFSTLSNKAQTAYEKGSYQEAIDHLSKMIEILQSKIGEPVPTELLDAGNGFYYSNVNFEESFSGLTRCYGEITNKSGNSYTLAFFKVSVYDLNGKLLAVGDIMISNLPNNDTVSFDAIIKDDGKIKGQYKYKIKFASGM